MVITAALLACAINAAQGTDVHPNTMEKIIAGESSANELAININHWPGRQPHPETVEEAIAIATRLIAEGRSIDMGLTQINNRNLASLRYSVADAFDPCKNIAGGGTILTSFYGAAVERYGAGRPALIAAISAYNTGSFWRGVENGYVSRIMGIPSIQVQVAHATTPHAAPRKPDDPFYANTAVYTSVALNIRID